MSDLLTRRGSSNRTCGKGQCFLNCPTIDINPSRDCSTSDPGYFRPLLERLCDSIEQQVASVAAIARLILSCAPSTVVWRVRAVIIQPLQGKVLRPSTHVREKLREISPSLTDCYSTSTVTFVRWVIRIRAAINHQSPNSIFGSSGITMRPADISNRISLQAATTESATFAKWIQLIWTYLNGVSALAAAEPENGFLLDHLNNSQATKGKPGPVCI